MPCKQKQDIENNYKTKELAKRKRSDNFKLKHSSKLRFFIGFSAQLFLMFGFLFQINEHYPKIYISSDTQILSKLIVIVSSIGVIFVTGVIVIYTYKILKNGKNT